MHDVASRANGYIEDNALVGVKYEKFVKRKPDNAVTNVVML